MIRRTSLSLSLFLRVIKYCKILDQCILTGSLKYLKYKMERYKFIIEIN